MGGKNNLVKPMAFIRSLLAFYEEGLYEVPHILTSLFLLLHDVSLGREYNTWYPCNTVHASPLRSEPFSPLCHDVLASSETPPQDDVDHCTDDKCKNGNCLPNRLGSLGGRRWPICSGLVNVSNLIFREWCCTMLLVRSYNMKSVIRTECGNT